MNDLDADEARVLDQARRGSSPSVADRQRVAQALLSQLAVSGSARSVPSRLESAALRAARWAGLAGLVALGGGVGYFQGYREGSKTREVVTVVRSLPPAVSAVPPSPLPVEQPPLPSVSEMRAPRVPSSGARAVAPSVSARAFVEAPRPTEPLGLDEEVRQLRRIEKAIREQNPRLALVLLEELDVAIPAGQLLEERKAASLMANCQLDAPSAKTDAGAFAAQHARSAYVARVSEICGLSRAADERISPPAGTSVPR